MSVRCRAVKRRVGARRPKFFSAAYHLRSDRRDGSERSLLLELTRGTMLDHCLVLRKNGVLLWRQSWAPMKGNPVDTLIRTVLMEVRRCTACAGIAWLVRVLCQAGLHECSSLTSAPLSLSRARARVRARALCASAQVC